MWQALAMRVFMMTVPVDGASIRGPAPPVQLIVTHSRGEARIVC